MQPKIFKKTEGIDRKISETYTVTNYLTREDSNKVSMAVGHAKDHEEIVNIVSDRAYFVLEGKIIVDDKLVGYPGDVIYIPANTSYRFEGTFRAVIVNSPPFRKQKEKIEKISG